MWWSKSRPILIPDGERCSSDTKMIRAEPCQPKRRKGPTRLLVLSSHLVTYPCVLSLISARQGISCCSHSHDTKTRLPSEKPSHLACVRNLLIIPGSAFICGSRYVRRRSEGKMAAVPQIVAFSHRGTSGSSPHLATTPRPSHLILLPWMLSFQRRLTLPLTVKFWA